LPYEVDERDDEVMRVGKRWFLLSMCLVISCTQAWRKNDCIVKVLGMKAFENVKTLIEGGRAEEAIQNLKELAQNPKDAKASGAWHYLLGRAYLGAQRFEDAVQALRQAKDYLPESNVVLNDLGVALVRAGYFEEGCATLGALHARFPNDLELTMNLLVAHAMCNLGASALDKATELAKKYEEDFFVQFNTAFIALTVKDYQTAQYHFRKALALRSGDKQGLLGLVYACLGANDLECAKEASKEAMMRYPQDPYCLAGKAMVLEASNDRQGAIDALSRAVSLDPACALCHYNLGRIAEVVGNRGLAVQSFEQYLRLTGSKDTQVQQRLLLLRSR
jgi:Flp pilus assembly protein TadD